MSTNNGSKAEGCCWVLAIGTLGNLIFSASLIHSGITMQDVAIVWYCPAILLGDNILLGSKVGGDSIILAIGFLLLGASLYTLMITKCFGISMHPPDETVDDISEEPNTMPQPLFYAGSWRWEDCSLHTKAIAAVTTFVGFTIGFSPLCTWAVTIWP